MADCNGQLFYGYHLTDIRSDPVCPTWSNRRKGEDFIEKTFGQGNG